MIDDDNDEHGFDDDADDHEDGAEDTAEVICPYCGEAVEISLDPGGGAVQEYIEDCQVCCRPWKLRVRFVRGGTATVTVQPDDDSGDDDS